MWSRIAIIGAACVAVLTVAYFLGEWLPHHSRTAPAKSAAADAKSSDIRIDFNAYSKPQREDLALAGQGVADGSAAEITTVVPRPILFIDGQTSVSGDTATAALQASYAKIRAYIAAHHLKEAGPPIAINEDFDTVKQIWKYRAGIPIAAAPATPPAPSDGITLAKSYGGTAARFVHLGDPNKAESTYGKIDLWMRSKGLKASGPTWEEYLSDPQTPVSAWRTNIYVPLG